MAQREKDGVIYEQVEGGWKVVGYTQPQGVMVRPADPSLPYAAPKAAADAQRAQNEAAASAYDPALAAAQARKAEADAQKIAMDLDAERRRVSGEKTPTQLLSERFKTDNLLQTIKEARQLVRKGNTTGVGSYLAYAPATDARNLSGKFDTLIANLSFDRLQEMRDNSATGGALGGVSEIELKLLGSTVASLDQGMSADEVLSSLDKIERHYSRFQAALVGFDPDTEEGKKALSAAVPSLNSKVEPDDWGKQDDDPLSVGIRRQYATEQDKRFGAVAQAAFNRGATFEEIDQLAKQFGYPGYGGTNLQDAIAYRDGTGPYTKQGPQKGAKIAAPESGLNDPGILERAVEPFANSPGDAAIRGAANALTVGGLDEIQGGMQALGGANYDEATAEANLVKNLTAKANPGANFGGNIAGGLLAGLITGGAGGAATFAPRAMAGDAMFGAAYGAGEQNDNRLGGAASGLLAGVVGGTAGRGLMQGASRAVGGIQNADAQLLRQNGVTLTPGQLGRADGGFLGRAISRREERLAGLPGSDVPIQQSRTRGMEQFNQGAFNQGSAPVGRTTQAIGRDGVEQTQRNVNAGYGDALDGVNLIADQQFAQGIGQRLQQAQGLPAIGDQAAFSLQRSIYPFVDQAGNITGRNMQNIEQELVRRASRFDNSADAVGPDAANILRGASDDLTGLVNRQSPGTAPAYAAAREAYRNSRILQDSVSRARNGTRSGEVDVFTPSQLRDAAEANAKRFGNAQGTNRVPFEQYTAAGQRLLPSTIPDSGTAGRAAEATLLGKAGAAMRAPRVGVMHNDMILEALNRLALDRSPGARAIGDGIARRARYGGLFGAPPAVMFATQ